tara:strand:+ start:1930 stop:2262 length:333 start_codon:yes stop_codon:yes gene_type:complete
MDLPKDIRLVYSTDKDTTLDSEQPEASPPQGDGIVRITRQTKGRKGKGVSIIDGLALKQDALKKLCSELKKKCGCGGTVVDFCIELQTQDREKVKILLEKKGFSVKLAGG